MKRQELELQTETILKKVCNSFGFYRDKKDFGSFKIKNDKTIFSITRAQLRTQGIYDNQFEFSIGGNVTILKIENLWKDLYYKTRPKSEFTELLKEVIPTTYSIKYDKAKISNKFPENVRETGWLNFELSDKGLKKFEEILTYIISHLLLPEFKNPKSIYELDSDVNSTIELDKLDKYSIDKNGFIYRRLIIAKLAGNDFFEDIVKYHQQGYDEYLEISKQKGFQHFANIPKVFEEVYERIKRL